MSEILYLPVERVGERIAVSIAGRSVSCVCAGENDLRGPDDAVVGEVSSYVELVFHQPRWISGWPRNGDLRCRLLPM